MQGCGKYANAYSGAEGRSPSRGKNYEFRELQNSGIPAEKGFGKIRERFGQLREDLIGRIVGIRRI
jgi:hypothetical protein